VGVSGLDSSGTRYGSVAGSFEHAYEISGFVKEV